MTINTQRTRRPAALLALLTLAALVASCAPVAPPSPPGEGPLTPSGRAALQQVKRTHFSQVLADEADRISSGGGAPLVGFTVEDTPPSIFVNWIVPDERAEDFAAAAGLPDGFSLAKVRILESDEAPRYWLSLNVYRVSGVTTGLRAEWSTYVDDGDGDPRFMILEARAAEGSLDPIGPLALPEPFTHRLEPDGSIRTAMRATVLRNGVPALTSANLFSSTIRLPEPDDRRFAVPTDEWVATNDFIYWVNGVNDRVYYDSSAHRAPLLSVELDDVDLLDDSEWAPYLVPEPGHVLVYLDELRFVISPWWNVTEVDGRVDPKVVASLASLKRTIYGGMTNQFALGVALGTVQPTVRSTVEASDADPSIHWHWRVPPEQLDEFRSAVGLPPGLELTPVRLEHDDAPDHWISLHVHRRSGTGAGLRAEWTTHVDDGSGASELVLGSGSDQGSLDPVALFSPPIDVRQERDGEEVVTAVLDGDSEFHSTIVVSDPAADVRASREWIGAGDRRYWRNGVADRLLYDAGGFAPRTSIDPASAQVDHVGRWAPFTAGSPDRIWLDRSPIDRAVSPWWNLSELRG